MKIIFIAQLFRKKSFPNLYQDSFKNNNKIKKTYKRINLRNFFVHFFKNKERFIYLRRSKDVILL